MESPVIDARMAHEPAYGRVARSLHWLIVVLLAAQFAVAWLMPDIHRGTKATGLIVVHLSLGTSILAIAALRLLWRWVHPVPLLADAVPPWQHRAARAAHATLYCLLFAVPFLGWANASARGFAVALFGFIPLPALMPQGSRAGLALGDIHTFVAYALLALVGLHVLASLYHHFWLRDRVLARMLPLASRESAPRHRARS
jgi:cytochrome b561